VIYLDSCALVKLIVTEAETPALMAFLDGRRAEMVSGQPALTEVIRVARRSCYDDQRRLRVGKDELGSRLAAAARILDAIDLVVVDRAVFLAAAALAQDPHVGTLDAIHLACAQEIGPELTAFVTYDKRMAQAAGDLGLPLVQPN
jgi:uncharacterized protein